MAQMNYAFHFAAELDSHLPFHEIPIPELCKALRDRLDKIEKAGTRDAFSMFDEMTRDQPDSQEPPKQTAAELKKPREAAAEKACKEFDFQRMEIIHTGDWQIDDGRHWFRLVYGEKAGEKITLFFGVDFHPKSEVIQSTWTTPHEINLSTLTLSQGDICFNCRHFVVSDDRVETRRGHCAKGNPADPWPGNFSTAGRIKTCSIHEPNSLI